MTENDPDYVVLGETRTYSFERITRAIRLVLEGARFIATNPDPTGPSAAGPLPATGSVAALISRATGVNPYFVGKPNPLMMRSALNALGAHSATPFGHDVQPPSDPGFDTGQVTSTLGGSSTIEGDILKVMVERREAIHERGWYRLVRGHVRGTLGRSERGYRPGQADRESGGGPGRVVGRRPVAVGTAVTAAGRARAAGRCSLRIPATAGRGSVRDPPGSSSPAGTRR